jgi:indolepyruvate ferredoxin oxidoreductase beta subunit
MAYDDIIRVADLKTRRSRFARVRDDVRASDSQVVRISDYLKPGLDELVSILPPKLASRILSFSTRSGFGTSGFPMKIKTSTVTGFLTLRAIACLRSRRSRSYRYVIEQSKIENWLDQLLAAARRDYDLALEVAACAGLIKGYGPTHRRSAGQFEAVLEQAPQVNASTLRELRAAAGAENT